MMSEDYFSFIDDLKAENQLKDDHITSIPRQLSIQISKGSEASLKKDKSNYFASITTINGVLNGGTGPLCLDLCRETQKYQYWGAEGKSYTWLSHGYLIVRKLVIIL